MFNLLFLISLIITSTLLSVTSHSWMGVWMGLEMNLMGFIPMIAMNNKNNMFMSEAMISYFLIQTLTSINLLFFIIMFKLNLLNSWLTELMMNFSLLMKMGAAPFHFWFPKIMSGLNWMNCLILSTWQKITPMVALSFCMNKTIIIMSIILCALIGAWGGINQTSIRSLMSFSSISHLSWLIMSIMISMNMWSLYFMIYLILNSLIMLMFSYNNFFYLNQMFNNKINYLIYFNFLMNLLSLGGLPPFLGFLPKWLIILFISNKMKFVILIMLISTLMTLSFYINIIISSMIINYSKIKWYNNKMNMKNNFMIFLLTTFSMFSLIFISLMNFSF
uniref:NADH-ubiquinone oxidoreductase chain 2 n=1 Tax=Rhyacophila kando TaxID=2904902 RepID=A0A9E8LPB8_9NEOP|nr:NADH dehydrogenase subunit 2 [Rhyacophila kando]UZZ44351.1 NADH dehydrogenase subunit 2 [Rhyacophila kando]